ncbi:hypothetical protein FALCPG4_015245 [Fusarium falciforme]
MSGICQRLRNGDESAKNAIICHATGEQMGSPHHCDQRDDHDPLLGGGRVVQEFFLGACSNCYQGRQISYTVRGEEDYQPSIKVCSSIKRKKSGVRETKA